VAAPGDVALASDADAAPPADATHWRARKKQAHSKQFVVCEDVVTEAAADGSVSELKIVNHEIGTWPGNLRGVHGLLSKKWGPGEYKIAFYQRDPGQKSQQVGAWYFLTITPPPPQAPQGPHVAPAEAPAPPPSALVGQLAGMFNGPVNMPAPSPASYAALDPMSQAMLAFQQMLTFQENARRIANEEARQAILREREDNDRRLDRDKAERERMYREDQERTRAHYKEMERLRLDAESKRDDDGTREAIEALSERLEEVAKNKGGGGDAPPWWMGIAQEVAAKAAPGLGTMLSEIASKMAAGAPAAVVNPGQMPSGAQGGGK
jgi:hypothetical protein